MAAGASHPGSETGGSVEGYVQAEIRIVVGCLSICERVPWGISHQLHSVHGHEIFSPPSSRTDSWSALMAMRSKVPIHDWTRRRVWRGPVPSSCRQGTCTLVLTGPTRDFWNLRKCSQHRCWFLADPCSRAWMWISRLLPRPSSMLTYLSVPLFPLLPNLHRPYDFSDYYSIGTVLPITCPIIELIIASENRSVLCPPWDFVAPFRLSFLRPSWAVRDICV